MFFSGLVMMACQHKPIGSKKYFDIDSLIDKQLEHLIQRNASLSKKASIDSVTDETTFRPDSASWANEMEVFRHLDVINKPIYDGVYTITDGIKDPNSNLLVKSFVANREIPVRSLKLYYQDQSGKLRKVEADLSEENALYFTSRSFSIELEDWNEQMVISKCRVEGVQKMILRDSVHFAISSEIIY